MALIDLLCSKASECIYDMGYIIGPLDLETLQKQVHENQENPNRLKMSLNRLRLEGMLSESLGT